ncbi:zinc-binding alcohol dehydrogenase family protein [Salinibacterium sp. dk2585]|uniref:quinone oxidoreductase family protein n=1 Tax=unclassified Salinibacterium TaxID=2632331 RepID=UPI0011C247B5|nr:MULTISPECIES: zinc-binding alcohol dehydrogenase family protein [unclassified Salinibacterium]QEE62157.1 zinc-binding alcohol dehydrogenase family protein [Salinibacterium sp. dk2585]TXK53509.1 zinc-binding alcohol dehydrogenase family protein [Salinibacterium sp. dk5596]
MKAVVTNAFGGTEQFELVERPIPEPAEGQVVIKNAYAGLIYADTLIRSGAYARWRAELPTVLGSEVVGTISAVGNGVTEFKVGDRVSAEMVRGGAYQEYSVAPVTRTTVIPDEASFEAAVVHSFNLPAAYLIYYNFVELSPESDRDILIHSAAGGLGSMLTLVAKKNGHRVIGLVSDPAKREACLSFGADDVIVTSEHPDYENEVLRLTDGRGVDVTMNHMAGEWMRNDLKALKFRGKLMLTNIIQGFPEADWELKNLIVNGSPNIVMAASATLYGTPEHRPALDYLSECLKEDNLQGLAEVYPFTAEGISEAHQRLETGKTVGKLAIKF